MNADSDSTTVALTGAPALALLVAAALALPVSIGLLRLYRRAVLRSMRTRADSPASDPVTSASDPVALEAPLTPDPPTDAGRNLAARYDALSASARPPVEALYSSLVRSPWRAAAVYAVAGLCFSVILTTAQLVATGTELLPFRFVVLTCMHAWPIVLIVSLAAATTRLAKLAIPSVYFLALAILGLVALARSPTLGVEAILVLWLITNLPASLLLLAFLNRRVRAVGPLVLIFFLLAVFGASLAPLGAGSSETLLGVAFEVGLALGLGASGVAIGMIFVGLVVFGVAGWLTLGAIRALYDRQKVSDQSITLDAVWLTFAIVYSITLVFEGVGWALSGLAAFVAYKVVALFGFRLLRRFASQTEPRAKLLLLRVFSLGKRSERLFDAVARHWRHVGTVRLIAGPDLATTTVEPHEFLDFLRGKLARRFIDGRRTLDLRISEMDIEPDPDGRFRVHDFFCYEDTWKMVLSRLVSESDAVLMDLRGFSPHNAGCAYEINELIDVAPLARVVFIVDDTTDEQFLSQVAHWAWTRMRATSPNRSSTPGQLPVYRLTGSRSGELKHLLRTISGAAQGGASASHRATTTP